jgi:uncharacterized repeat protein (TIGR01451 family)
MFSNKTLATKLKNNLLTFGLVVSLVGFSGSLLAFSQNLDTSKNTQVLGATSGKEGYDLRFNANTNGALVFAGNTLCLSEETASHGSCGTFISSNPNQTDPDFTPQTAGTTANWQDNGSTSELVIPEGAEVLYAELIWGGSYKYLETDLSSQLDTPITLKTKYGEYQVSPDTSTGGDITSSNSYVRTSEVTDIIKAAGTGEIMVKGVPGLIVKNNPYNNYVGYTLAVAYRDDSMPARNLSIFVGAEQVGADQFTNTAEVTGFSTPTSGEVNGKLFVSAGEGDHMYSGDQMRFGSNPSNLSPLSGNNNKQNNFFASQINGSDSSLDQSGSFGDKNQKINQANKPAVRQGWDITGVDISQYLSNNQTTAYAQGTSSGDSYVINALGMQIDINSAYPEVDLSLVGSPKVCVEETLTYQIVVKNNGTARSESTVLRNFEFAGVEVVTESLKVDGQSANFATGDVLSYDLGAMEPGDSKIVTYEVLVTDVADGGVYENSVTIDYNYQMYAGGELVSDVVSSPVVSTNLDPFCGIDQPPVAVDDFAEVESGKSVDISILDNDNDPDGVTTDLVISIIDDPLNGQVIVNDDGTVTYTPNPEFDGEDGFVYEICDSSGGCDQAEVVVAVNPKTMYPPVAVDDTEEVTKNQSATILNLENDSDQDGQLMPETLEIISQPSNGTIEISYGKLIYTPNQDYTGTDNLTYKICDNDSLCDQAVVSLTIIGEPLPPLAVDDQTTTNKDQEVVISVIDNDDPVEGQLVTETIRIIENPAGGQVVVTGNEIEYMPDPGFVGQDSFVYEVCNQNELCDQATVTVGIVDEDGPEPDGQVGGDLDSNIQAIDDSESTRQGQPVTILILENDSEQNPQDLQIISQPSNGTASVTSDNKLVYTPDDGFFGVDQLTYKVCDSLGNCDTAEVTIEVKPQGQVLGDSELIRSGGGSILAAVGFGSLATIMFVLHRQSRKKSKMKVTMG